MLKKITVILILLSIPLVFYANEKDKKKEKIDEIIKPEGQLKLNKYGFNLIDSADNIIKLYPKHIRLKVPGNTFTYIFTRNENFVLMFNDFMVKLRMYHSFTGIGSGIMINGPIILLPGIIGSIYNYILNPIFENIFSVILYPIGLGICLIIGIVFIIIGAVYYTKARKQLQLMVDEYNKNIPANSELKSENKINMQVFSYKFGLK